MNWNERCLRWMEQRWQAIALSAVCICLTAAVLAGIQAKSVAAFADGDWGVSFGVTGAPPRGNVSAEDLRQYDAYYLGNTDEKKIYLTFDAGYENGQTAAILDTLKKHNVPAAFFLVEHYLNTAPDLVKRMVDEGHVVGNHTATHPDMSKLKTADDLKKELTPVENRYKELTGKDLPKYYRPPQGKFSESNLRHAQELGYTTVFWSLAYVDWNVNAQPDPQAALRKLTGRIHPGAIILLHSTSKTNAEILGRLIEELRGMGYTFAPLTELCRTGSDQQE